ncbi:hypothetical protein RQP46_001186 [Phenoliferia psychrophenolica]
MTPQSQQANAQATRKPSALSSALASSDARKALETRDKRSGHGPVALDQDQTADNATAADSGRPSLSPTNSTGPGSNSTKVAKEDHSKLDPRLADSLASLSPVSRNPAAVLKTSPASPPALSTPETDDQWFVRMSAQKKSSEPPARTSKGRAHRGAADGVTNKVSRESSSSTLMSPEEESFVTSLMEKVDVKPAGIDVLATSSVAASESRAESRSNVAFSKLFVTDAMEDQDDEGSQRNSEDEPAVDYHSMPSEEDDGSDESSSDEEEEAPPRSSQWKAGRDQLERKPDIKYPSSFITDYTRGYTNRERNTLASPSVAPAAPSPDLVMPPGVKTSTSFFNSDPFGSNGPARVYDSPSPSSTFDEQRQIQQAIERSQQDQEDAQLQAVLAMSLALPLPTSELPPSRQPTPTPSFDASALTRPDSAAMLGAQLDGAYYSRELEVFRQKWMVELALSCKSAPQRKAPVGNSKVTFKFGPKGDIIEYRPTNIDSADDRMDTDDTAESRVASSVLSYSTLSPSAQALITYQALRSIEKNGDSTEELKAQLSASRKVASDVLYELVREFGSVIQFEPVEDETMRDFAILQDRRNITDPDDKFDEDVRLWLRTMSEKDVLLKEANDIVAAKKRKLLAIGEDELERVEDEDATYVAELEAQCTEALANLAVAQALAASQSEIAAAATARADSLELENAKLKAEREDTVARLQAAAAQNESADHAVAELLLRLTHTSRESTFEDGQSDTSGGRGNIGTGWSDESDEDWGRA